MNDWFPFAHAVKVLSIFVIYRICRLECHISTIAAVCDRCHA